MTEKNIDYKDYDNSALTRTDMWNNTFSYLIKGSITGIILAGTFFFTPLTSEVHNESNAKAKYSNAQVKVKHYKELKDLAMKSETPKIDEDAFNDKYKLKYELAKNEVEINITASERPGKNMELVSTIAKNIFILSVVAFGLSLLFWLIQYMEAKSTFQFSQSDIGILAELLNKEIQSVLKNKHVEDDSVIYHQALLRKLSQKKTKKKLPLKN